ncbi:hypothetical protein pb186bvf_009248 [Paramecium bursaria]
MQFKQNSFGKDYIHKPIQAVVLQGNVLRRTYSDYKRKEFQIFFNNTFELLKSLLNIIEKARLQQRANLPIQSTRYWEGWNRYNYNDPRTKKIYSDPLDDVGTFTLLQWEIFNKSLEIKPLKQNQLNLVKKAQDRNRSKKFILQIIAKMSNITDLQLNDFFNNCQVLIIGGQNRMVSWNGKKIYINQSLFG